MTRANVAIVASGGANIASLRFALDRLGAASEVTSDAGKIGAASHVILPGVGAAANAMETLRADRLDRLIPALTQPVLGICLGMHLLALASEEDRARCLGVLPADARRIPASTRHPVPHMGWAPVRMAQRHPLFRDIADGSYFYFLHSFALPVADHTLAVAAHAQPLSAACARDNFLATQFHPERSSTAGAQLLRNFLAL